MTRILIVDPEAGPRAELEQLFADREDDVFHAANAEQALDAIELRQPAALLCAATLDGKGPDPMLRLCASIRGSTASHRLVLVVFSREPIAAATTRAALEAGADAVVGPDALPCIDATVDAELAKRRLLRSASELIGRLRDENRLLDDERRKSDARLVQTHATDPAVIANEVIASRPDGALLVDAEGRIVAADVGSRELVGHGLVGQPISKILPRSRLASVIGASTGEEHSRFAFDVDARRDRAPRRLQATVTALHGGATDGPGRIVLLVDLERRGPVEAAVRRTATSVTDDHYQRLLEAARAHFSLDAMPVRSEASQRLHRALVAASRHLHPVLLRGPSGSGRRGLAEILHHARHATGPLLELSCDGLDEVSQENELFGRELSSGKRSTGLVELARDGSLLLHEVEALSFDLQRRVAAVAGDARLRLIATTTASTEALVASGRLVQELSEAFAPGLIEVPPLRDRRDDLEAMIARALGGDAFDRLTESALNALVGWSWPGGLPELESELARLASIVDRRIDVADLGPEVGGVAPVNGLRDVELAPYVLDEASDGTATHKSAAWIPGREEWTITEEDPIDLDLYQKKAVLRALAESGGNRTKAAELLGVGKSSLYRKLTKWGIIGDSE
ncbi:MAG: sigma 54-interacting transcriptional regulator [Planctomycetota bacterium]